MWQEIWSIFNIAQPSDSNSLIGCFGNWMRGEKDWIELPCFVFWEIWLHKNKVLFESVDYSIGKVVNRSISAFKEFHLGIKAHRIWDDGPPIVSSFEVSVFFDGSLQGRGVYCGNGGTIRVGNSLCFDLKIGGGSGSNNRVELLDLWMALFFTRS